MNERPNWFTLLVAVAFWLIWLIILSNSAELLDVVGVEWGKSDA
jgi:hypothetical protein